MKIRFVTGNPGKLLEAKAALQPLGHTVVRARAATIEIQSDRLDDIATIKALQLVDSLAAPYFLEDAGLFVDALDGFPGPYSAYAYRTLGCQGLLRLMRHLPARRRGARFQAVVAYVDARLDLHLFRGTVEGRIARSPAGRAGFGFDPVFAPGDRRQTFAQVSPQEKNRLSHRGRALAGLARHLAAERAPTKRVKRDHPVRRTRAP